MANEWIKLSNDTWGVKTPLSSPARTGDTVTVTRANQTTSDVVLGGQVSEDRWKRVFVLAGKAVPAARPARRRPARRRARRPARRRVSTPAPRVVAPRRVVAPVAVPAPVFTPVVDDPETDPSVLRFRLIILED